MHLHRLLLFALLDSCISHGHVTYPPSTRHGGSLTKAGHCLDGECLWFSQPTSIPGKPTLPQYARSYNVDVSGGDLDWSASMPWRAPGTAPVMGSGCGIAGGNAIALPNGGTTPRGDIPQGMDGVGLPAQPPTIWAQGSTQKVAFGITANHGGGYQYRLCKLSEGVSEECFQKTPLKFADDKQWLQHDALSYQYDKLLQLPDFEIPLVKTSEGTFPADSEWARVPVPGCRLCDQSLCGPGLWPNMTDVFQPNASLFPGSWHGGQKWFEQQQCAQTCAGINVTKCPPYMVQFPEPLPGISGYTDSYLGGFNGLTWNVVDMVVVPDRLEPGEYLLSWRWDCEQSHQIWQNCADIKVVATETPTNSIIFA